MKIQYYAEQEMIPCLLQPKLSAYEADRLSQILAGWNDMVGQDLVFLLKIDGEDAVNLMLYGHAFLA